MGTMGKRGPRNTPTAALKIAGTYREDRHGGRMEAEAGAPARPSWIRDGSCGDWERLVAELLPIGILSVLDQTSLAILVEAIQDYIECRRLVEENGRIAISEKGGTYQHPAVGMANQAWDRVLKACREFGLTPASRASLKVEKPKQQDNQGKARFFAG